jgi:7,8-dihydro-6-hydroxymethylpterin-pyrophosphokinase
VAKGKAINRIIDIDLIAFDEEIINSEKLQIPHPLMQDRKFVLLPIQDLNLDWKHPILKEHLRVIRGFRIRAYVK